MPPGQLLPTLFPVKTKIHYDAVWWDLAGAGVAFLLVAVAFSSAKIIRRRKRNPRQAPPPPTQSRRRNRSC